MLSDPPSHSVRGLEVRPRRNMKPKFERNRPCQSQALRNTGPPRRPPPSHATIHQELGVVGGSRAGAYVYFATVFCSSRARSRCISLSA